MRIIVVGCGNVGLTLTEQLSKEGHNITVIEEQSSVVQTAVVWMFWESSETAPVTLS